MNCKCIEDESAGISMDIIWGFIANMKNNDKTERIIYNCETSPCNYS